MSVTITNCHFENSTSSLAKAQFRGNSGGLSIGYHTADPSTTSLPKLSITESTFVDNSVLLPSQNSSQQIDLALNDHYYFGRGGGLGIFIDESYTNVTTEISSCIFIGNYAESFGGGLYLYVDGNETHHMFIVTNCSFLRNSAGPGSFGGGLQIALLIRNLNSPPCTFTFSNCSFTENTADFGGGLSSVQVFSQGEGNVVSVLGSHFFNNTGTEVGSAVMFASLLYVQNRVESLHYRVRDW